MSIIRFTFTAALLGIACALPVGRSDAATTVTQILPQTGSPVVGPWYETDMQAGATIGIVDLAGVGGNLETAQPLPTGAAKITTPAVDNNGRAQAYTYNDFGNAATFLNNVTMGYSFYKSTNLSNTAAAPALKIQIAATGGTGDNFGTLIYEPYWQGADPTPDVWHNVSISATDGSGPTGSGGWWWNGGFGVANGGGGPPIQSLTEWAAAFTLNDPVDFATARVIAIGVGEGTYNPGEVSYFDNVSYSLLGGGETWDFEVIPEPASLGLAGIAAIGMIAVRRRQRLA